jgi:hypothetical protein
MPAYITKSVGVNGLGIGGVSCQDSSCNSKFFSNLANKLMEMATAVNKRIDDIKKNCNKGAERGFLLASIETPVMQLGVKYEYLEYIKRFGPPVEGKFDEAKLEQLRIELGIDNTSTTI